MGAYNDLVLTDAGRALYAKKIADGTALEFTKVKLGDGTPTVDPTTLTDLVSSKLVAQISSITSDGAICTIIANKDNDGLAENTAIKEIGLIAKDTVDGADVDVLYAYINAPATYDTLFTPAYGYHNWQLTLKVSVENITVG